jgi:hypothetical protein
MRDEIRIRFEESAAFTIGDIKPAFTVDALELYKILKGSQIRDCVDSIESTQEFIELRADSISVSLIVKTITENAFVLSVFSGLVANFIYDKITKAKKSSVKILITKEDALGNKSESNVECNSGDLETIKEILDKVLE